ncbi:MAG: methionine synthase [Oscillospiraceae bacterium]
MKISSDFSDIKINKAEILNYLGYNQDLANKNLDYICDEAADTIERLSGPAYLYSYFDIEKKDDGILVCDTPLLLRGKSISYHLKSCGKIALLCVTLSNAIDRVIMQAKFDVLKQLFLDVAASVYIEQICERVFEMIKDENPDLFLTKRYGVGYGDLSLIYQQDVLTILNAQKRIGVMATADGILTPRKSITAIVGLSSSEIISSYKPCDSCILRNDCKYFMRGEYCGK